MNIFIMSRPGPGPARPAHTRPRPGPSPMCLNCFQPRPGPGPQYVGPGPGPARPAKLCRGPARPGPRAAGRAGLWVQGQGTNRYTIIITKSISVSYLLRLLFSVIHSVSTWQYWRTCTRKDDTCALKPGIHATTRRVYGNFLSRRRIADESPKSLS